MSFDNELFEDSLAGDVSISIYPNPVESLINIKLNNYKGGEIECAVYDITGHKVSETIKCSSLGFLDLDGLASGIYIIHVKYNAMLYYEKISKL